MTMADAPAGGLRAVVIGASAGGIQALSHILPLLPEGYPMPVLVVIHMPADGGNVLAPLFQKKCRLSVREAEDKEPATPGTIFFAPPGYHMLVEAEGTLALSSDEPVLHSRPSIDVLLESAADAFDEQVIGVILTGASPDGARGLRAIADAGGIAIVEDPSAAYASAMPLAALDLCPTAMVLSLDAIGAFLRDIGGE
ncbi:chemotaxis protein CheB [Novosphingobium sp. BL-8H]|uniref:chemotaxis protein CheB n=1 Tax=Novosphingobium sp. BL-8H TaxID=3127640 RepID=UPI0037581F39